MKVCASVSYITGNISLDHHVAQLGIEVIKRFKFVLHTQKIISNKLVLKSSQIYVSHLSMRVEYEYSVHNFWDNILIWV
jgi:hypothetical protein